MSLFDKIFGGAEEEKQDSKIGWRQLTDLGQLNEILEISNETFAAGKIPPWPGFAP